MGLQEGEEGRRVLGWGGTASDSRLANLSEPHPPAGFKQWEGGVEPLGVQNPGQLFCRIHNETGVAGLGWKIRELKVILIPSHHRYISSR